VVWLRCLQASRPRLLSLDDLLACRCVCKQWRQRLGTAFCHTIRIPHSLWSEASTPRLAACISAAAAAYPHASDLLLEAGGSRPGLAPELWQPLLQAINPWLAQQPVPRSSSSSSSSSVCISPAGPAVGVKPSSYPKGGTHSGSGGKCSGSGRKCLHLHLQAPPSPHRLQALGQLQHLSHLRLQHTSQSLYSRHLSALCGLSQLQSLVLLLSHPRLDLKSLAHQRARRVPLKMDCLSSMQRLTQLELSSQGPAGEASCCWGAAAWLVARRAAHSILLAACVIYGSAMWCDAHLHRSPTCYVCRILLHVTTCLCVLAARLFSSLGSGSTVACVDVASVCNEHSPDRC
jgi:hypothetical protein